MNKKRAAPTIDFADSQYKSLQTFTDGTLIIYIDSWEEQPLRIVFKDMIQFSYRSADLPGDLYEFTDSTPLLEEALLSIYHKIPNHHLFKLFQFENIYDFPFIQIVAESVHVLKE